MSQSQSPTSPLSNLLPTSSQPEPSSSAMSDRQPVVRTRANISNACLACRKRKTKCIGGTPCKRCSTIGTECIFDQSQDRRRRDYNDRQRAEAEYPKRVLNALLKSLKSDSTRDRILDMIQRDATVEELAYQLGISRTHMDDNISLSADTDGHNDSIGRRSSSLDSGEGDEMQYDMESTSHNPYPSSSSQPKPRTAIMNVRHLLDSKPQQDGITNAYTLPSLSQTSPSFRFQTIPQNLSLLPTGTSPGQVKEPNVALSGPPNTLHRPSGRSSPPSPPRLPAVFTDGMPTTGSTRQDSTDSRQENILPSPQTKRKMSALAHTDTEMN